jgi:hypothetical protein
MYVLFHYIFCMHLVLTCTRALATLISDPEEADKFLGDVSQEVVQRMKAAGGARLFSLHSQHRHPSRCLWLATICAL